MKYWMAVASREHVLGGVKGGFMQVCHGKAGPLKKMKADDWVIYYSPTEKFGEKGPCRKFTAIGRICSKEPYLFTMNEDFTPWRRDVTFLKAKETPIEPLIDELSFITNKAKWGFPFRWGCFSILYSDFHLIAMNMGIRDV
jgi:predicted RNA-binding protein